MTPLEQELRKHAPPLFEATPVLFAYLYGSRVTKQSHPFSDLDVGIYVDPDDVKANLQLELSLSLSIDKALDHAVQSDVRILNHLPLAVTGRILGEAKLIYSRSEQRRIGFESRVRRAYFDFLPVIHQHQETYRKKLLSG
jgi:predicted nucleotidyltransferase